MGDPVIVTAPNEFEGKTGEVAEFSPSGKFVVVNLYNHGKHSMHLSDIEYNQYADKQEDDDWYDDELNEFAQFLVPAAMIATTPVRGFAAGLPDNPLDLLPEGWSDAIVAQRTGRPRTPYSVYIKGKKWKDFENEDHAEAVANKLRAKFKAEGRDPSVITIAATGSVDEEKTRLDPKCWTGKKIGNPKTKMKGGVRVNNCVPAEEGMFTPLGESYTDVMESQGVTDSKLLNVARRIDAFAKAIK